MGGALPVVFLVDVGDTLLENDRIQNDIREDLEREFGADSRDPGTTQRRLPPIRRRT